MINVIPELINLRNGSLVAGDKLSADICQAAINEIKQLMAAIGTPEVYAGVVSAVMEEENEQLKAELAGACKDTERIDWLEEEWEREQHSQSCRSLFRSNTPITRKAIDAAREVSGEARHDNQTK